MRCPQAAPDCRLLLSIAAADATPPVSRTDALARNLQDASHLLHPSIAKGGLAFETGIHNSTSRRRLY